MQNKSTLLIVRAGVIAGLYVVLSFVTLPISGGAIQFRPAECLTLLPLLLPESIPALFFGCLIFNTISALPIYDVVFGSLITLIAGVGTFFIGKLIKTTWLKLFFGGLFPVLLNAFFLPIIWYYCYGQLEMIYILSVLSLTISQALSVYLLGCFVYSFLLKLIEKQVKFLR